MAYEFHYTPTGTGVISGKEVLEQTEDAINDLGNTAISGVEEALDKAEQALTNSQNAVDDAQTALNTANNAEGVAIQAQTDVSNLSGTVTNIGNRVTTAEGNITNLQGRMTTAESGISGLTTRMGTAEGNIDNLQTAVSTAQATANSAQQTANTARQQSYVLRYSSSSVTDNSTIAYSTLDNTDNIKANDKIIDVDGKIFTVVSVDTANQTVTVGSALIDLALDGNVVHTSGNETVGGEKTFNDLQIVGYGTQYKGARNAYILPEFSAGYSGLSITTLGYGQTLKIGNFVLDANNKPTLDTSKGYIQVATGENNSVNACVLEPRNSTSSTLGTSANKWTGIYATNYYYGSNNTEFSTKFVTTDTNQTVSGQKIFSDINTDSSNAEIGVSAGNNSFKVLDKNKKTISRLEGGTFSTGMAYSYLLVNNGSDVFNGVSLYQTSANSAQLRPYSSTLGLQLGASNRSFSDCYTSKINGLTPSSLGMPVTPSSTSYLDISGYITVLDSSAPNTYTPPSNGYITFSVTGNLVQIFHDYGLQGKWTVQAGNANRGFIPVVGGVEVKIYVTASVVDKFWFIPCQGNI